MKKIFISIATAGCLMSAQAAVFQYTVNFTGPNEFPANASPGIGSGLVDYDSTLHTLSMMASFSGLTGTTTASHIHSPTTAPFFQNAGVATTTPSFTGFPLGVTAGLWASSLDLTLASGWNPSYVAAHGGTFASAEADLTASFATGLAYWNIHSSTFPGGEIRGFLIPVPEPSSLALLGLGAAGLTAGIARRRQNSAS